jgi:hypothetical protein
MASSSEPQNLVDRLLLLISRHVRTTKEPVQPIPLFEELVALLMEEDNRHVSLNVHRPPQAFRYAC